VTGAHVARRRTIATLALLAAVVALALVWSVVREQRAVRGVTGWVSPIRRNRLRAIYEAGTARGNLPGVFTVVGDSISADARFLQPIGRGDYDLGEYGALQAAIDAFWQPNGRGEPPFAARSWAVAVGWTTADVLDPAWGVFGVCGADESPLACEYRTARPSVALIMLGTNDLAAGRPVESYRANLQRILDLSLEMGVIPVLSTIPPQPVSAERDARVSDFNAVVRELAAEYAIPLWDYWRALQDLPERGISPDGVHPNGPPDGRAAVFDDEHLAYGYTVRNLGALDALETVRRALG